MFTRCKPEFVGVAHLAARAAGGHTVQAWVAGVIHGRITHEADVACRCQVRAIAAGAAHGAGPGLRVLHAMQTGVCG